MTLSRGSRGAVSSDNCRRPRVTSADQSPSSIHNRRDLSMLKTTRDVRLCSHCGAEVYLERAGSCYYWACDTCGLEEELSA